MTNTKYGGPYRGFIKLNVLFYQLAELVANAIGAAPLRVPTRLIERRLRVL